MSTTPKPLRILIAEDNAGAANALGQLMRMCIEKEAKLMFGEDNALPLEIKITSRLDDLLKITQTFRADVTLLDLILEDSTDWRLTADAIELIHKPVIVMTALRDPDIELYCKGKGAKEVFYKPLIDTLAGIFVSTVIGAHIRNVAPGVLTKSGTGNNGRV